jgi:type II secretory pathway pseudopilin PulG
VAALAALAVLPVAYRFGRKRMSDNLTERIEAIKNAYEEIRATTQQVVVGTSPSLRRSSSA